MIGNCIYGNHLNVIGLHQPLLIQEGSATEFTWRSFKNCVDLSGSEIPASEDEALKGSVDAAARLARYYSCVSHCPTETTHCDTEKNLFWTEIGVENGSFGSFQLLKKQGDMKDRNRSRAMYWAKKAEDEAIAAYWNKEYKVSGSGNAKPKLKQSERAEIVEKDLTEPEIQKLEAEALKGSPESALRLYLFYKYFRADPAESFYWAHIAAQNGDPAGQFELGLMLSGDADANNRKRAAFWLKKAAESGDTSAEALLQDLSAK